MKTTNKTIGKIIAGCVFACCLSQNLNAQVPSPTGGGGDTNNSGTNVHNLFGNFNPTPVYTYPTNATLKWTLNFDSTVWCQSLTPDGNLIVLDLAYADYKFYSINPSLVDTNDQNYPAPDDFTNWVFHTYSFKDSKTPVVTVDSNMCVAATFAVNTGNGSTVLYDPNTYVASNNIGLYDGICGLSTSNASLNWSFIKDIGDDLSAVCLGNDGTYYTSESGFVYALTNAPGKTNIIVTSEGKHIFLQNIGVKWFYENNGGESVDSFQHAQIAANQNELYVFNPYWGCIYAFNITNGTFQWYIPLIQNNDGQFTTPAICGDGTIYFVGGTNLCAVNPNSNTTNGVMGFKWTYYDTNYQYQYYTYSPIVGSDGTIYVEYQTWNFGSSFYNNRLVAINPSTGGEIWNKLVSTDGKSVQRTGSLAIGSDGEIYLADTDGMLYSFDPNGNINWSYETGSGTLLRSPLIAPDGTLYVGSSDYLYAFQIPTGLACSPWPEDFRNARRTSTTATASTSNPLYTAGSFQFTVSSYTNFPACVFSSSDLIHWDNLGQILLTGGNANFVDIGVTNYPYRFYRAMPQ